MPLGCYRTQQTDTTTPPASRRARVRSPLLPGCVRFINSRAALIAPPGRKPDIHWSNETLFWAFTFTLFYGDLCVCTGFTCSLERSHFSQPPSGGFYFFAAVVVVSAKITAGFQGSVV